jgi:hypothetical protein
MVLLPAFSGSPAWMRINYTNTTAFVGIVKINHYDADFPVTVEDGDYIGAFVGGECRMIAPIFKHEGELYVSAVIHGGDLFNGNNDSETVEFRVWDNSSGSEVSKIIKGTLLSRPSGEILQYEIGKPNTNKELALLEIVDIPFTPVFSPATTDYKVNNATRFPEHDKYIAVAEDARATVNIIPATGTSPDNITYIMVTAEDGTTLTYRLTFDEQNTTISPDVKDDQGMLLYPAVTSGNIMVKGIESGSKILVYSVSGQLVLIHENPVEKQTIDVSSFEKGVYTLIVKKENKTGGSFRFIKK